MKQSLGIIALLCGAGFAQPVFADTYSVTLLDGSGPTIDGTGSFTFSAGTFSNFTIIWDTLLFDFTSTANATPSETHGCVGGSLITVFAYLLDPGCQNGGAFPGESWLGGAGLGGGKLLFSPNIHAIAGRAITTGPPSNQTGDFRVIDLTTTIPEPNSVILMLAALLAVAFVARKRNARGRSPATQTIR
jgi:hypothetical protein